MKKNKQKNLCIIQARYGSTRLPGKVLKKVDGLTLLEYEIIRVKQAKKIDKIVIATTKNKSDKKIEELCQRIKIDCFCGSENDVLDRYYQCSLEYPEYKNVIRITGDCPLIDPVIIDKVISFFTKRKLDYTSNIELDTFPDGMDVEIFKKDILIETAKRAKLPSEREHVTYYIRKNKKYKKGNLTACNNWSHFRLTVDEPIDFEVIKFLIKNSKITDGYLDYISLLTKNPKVMLSNINIIRNEWKLKALKEDGEFKKQYAKKIH
ncbi:MAG: glycosyltransferase family protein [Patescibacteria group bacterium]|jgi:spore coat polysaccharide biosynthesis protein SpsF